MIRDSDAFIFALYPFLFSAVLTVAGLSFVALRRTRNDSHPVSFWWFVVGTFIAQIGDFFDEIRVLINRLVFHDLAPAWLTFMYTNDFAVIAGKGLKALGSFIAASIVWVILTRRPFSCLRNVTTLGVIIFAVLYPILAYIIYLNGG